MSAMEHEDDKQMVQMHGKKGFTHTPTMMNTISD